MSVALAKLGTDTPSRANTRTTRSTTLLRFSAERMPRGRAMIQAQIHPRTASSLEIAKRFMISGNTGVPVRKLSPKSPVTARPIQLRYCSTSGRSRPSFRSHMARSSGVCSMPRMPLTTSPGISCMMTKIAMLMPMRMGMSPSSRRMI